MPAKTGTKFAAPRRVHEISEWLSMPERRNVMEKQSQEVTRSQQTGIARNRGEWTAMRPFDWTPRDFFSAGPFSLMRRMSEEMDRVFGEFGFGRTSRDTNTSGETNM
jgi:hypothetical protein